MWTAFQIAALYGHILAAEKHQNIINETLDHVELQQKELASTLDAYERASQELLGSQGRTLDTGPADNERDKKCVPILHHFILLELSFANAATHLQQT